MWIVKANMPKDYPVMSQDVSLKVWGNRVPMLRGKTVRRRAPVVTKDVIGAEEDLVVTQACYACY